MMHAPPALVDKALQAFSAASLNVEFDVRLADLSEDELRALMAAVVRAVVGEGAE